MMKIRRQHFIAAIVGAFFFLPGLVLWLYVPSKTSTSAGGGAERAPMFGWHDDIGGERYGVLFYPRGPATLRQVLLPKIVISEIWSLER